MTSLRGPGERNFNAVSHKPKRASIQSVPVAPVSFGLWDTALKFLSPGPRNDVTDDLDEPIAFFQFSLLSPASLLQLLIVAIQKICYHGNVTSHFSFL